MSIPARRRAGNNPARADISARSAQDKHARDVCRFSTANRCRSSKISISFDRSDRPSSTSHPTTRMRTRYQNRRATHLMANGPP